MGFRLTLLCMFAVGLHGEYLNLVATADGRTVYFQMNASPGTTAWYAVRMTDSGLVTDAVAEHVADISDSGQVVGSANLLTRYCGTAGSTCFLQPGCKSNWSLQGPGIDVRNERWRTFLRLDGAGSLVWMEQDMLCPVYVPSGMGTPPPLSGLFEVATMRSVALAKGAILASRRHGRHLITNDGRALVLSGRQLQWLDGNGVASIRHLNGAWEAVTDARGNNVVYVEDEVGELHWVVGGGDFRLGLVGSAPALTADGSAMYFLDSEGALLRYDARTHTANRVGEDTHRAFVLTADFVFAITNGGRIVRIDPVNGETVVWQEVMPEVSSFDASFAPFFIYCPLYCYSETLERALWLEVGKRVRVFGRNLSQPGWRVDGGIFDVPLEPVSDVEAGFDTPSVLTRVPQSLTFYHVDRAVRFRMPVALRR